MQLFTNNAASKLAVGISSSAVTLQLATGDGAKFPAPTGADYFLLTLSKISGGIESDVEIVKVTERIGDTLSVIRAQEGTTAKIYAEDDYAQLRITAGTAAANAVHNENTSNPHSVTKAQVGLGSVDNTSDADKPVSSAQSTALGLKFDKTGGSVTGNITVNNGTDSRTLLQVSGVTEGQVQATGSAVRLASNNTTPLVLSTNGVDRVTADNVGNILFGGDTATGTFTFRGTNANDLVVFESTDTSASAAPDVVLYRNSASPAASDQLGVIVWRGKDSGAADQQYARMGAAIADPTAASEDGELWFEVTVAGAAVERFRLTAAGATLVGALSATTLLGDASGATNAVGYKLKSATTLVDVAAATAPTVGQVLTATSSTAATWQTPSVGSFQPLDADLTAIAALAGTNGLLKKTAANTWSLDTATYLTTTGSAASLTSFPTFNQNTTGTAANVTGVVAGANGGTGVANTGKTVTLGGNLTTSGAFNTTLTVSGATAVTLPTSGTLLSTAAPVTVAQGGTGVATLTGLVKGAGTANFSAATVRVDYAEPTTALATGILKNTTTTGAHSIAVAGTDYQLPIGTISGLVKGNGANALTAATAADVTGQALTGFVSGAGTVAATDTILQAINKLNGNDALKANLVSPTFTTPNIGVASGTSFNSITGLSAANGTAHGTAAAGVASTAARGDHVHPLQTSVSGNAGTVTNAALTTALTVNTGTVTLSGNVANTSVLTLGAGASSVSGANTGDNAVNTTYAADYRAANFIAGTNYIAPSGALGTPASGNLVNCTKDGTNGVGYLEIPQNSQSAAYTCVLADSAKHVFHPSADTTARTFTIPANASVAYRIGTAITFVNQNGAGVITIAITTDTMRLAGAGTTGSRTLAANGTATALKLTATEWIISGTGLS